MSDNAEQQEGRGASGHDQAMAKYKALDLKLDDRGAVQLTTDAIRRIFAYGYFSEGYAPKHLDKWRKVDEGIRLLQGMGCPALSNLQFVYYVRDNITAMHKLCLAACEATNEVSKYVVTWVDKDNKPISEENVVGFEPAACVVRVRRKGREEDALGFYTVEDAAKNNLLNKKGDIWKNNTKDMLWHRASMRALTQHFSDVLQGVRCKEIEELQPMLSESGQPLTTESGEQLYQRRISRQQEAQSAFQALKK